MSFVILYFINKTSFKFLNTSYLKDAKVIQLGKYPYEILKLAPQTIKVQMSKPFGCIGVKTVALAAEHLMILLCKFFAKQLAA